MKIRKKIISPCGCHYYYAYKKALPPRQKEIKNLVNLYKTIPDIGGDKITIWNTLQYYVHNKYLSEEQLNHLIKRSEEKDQDPVNEKSGYGL